MRRWQVVTVLDADDRPHQCARAFTETGAWRRAARWRRARTFFRQHFSCGPILAEGCADDACDISGWFEVRRVGDNRTLNEYLDDEAAAL